MSLKECDNIFVYKNEQWESLVDSQVRVNGVWKSFERQVGYVACNGDFYTPKVPNPLDLGAIRWWQFNGNYNDTVNDITNTNAVPWSMKPINGDYDPFVLGLNNKKCFRAQYSDESPSYTTQTYMRSNASDTELKNMLYNNSTCMIGILFVFNRRYTVVNTKAAGSIEFVIYNSSTKSTIRCMILFVNNNGKMKLQLYRNTLLYKEMDTNVTIDTTNWHYAICRFVMDENSNDTHILICVDDNDYDLGNVIVFSSTSYVFECICLGDYVGSSGNPKSECFQYIQDFTLFTDVSDTKFYDLKTYYKNIMS